LLRRYCTWRAISWSERGGRKENVSKNLKKKEGEAARVSGGSRDRSTSRLRSPERPDREPGKAPAGLFQAAFRKAEGVWKPAGRPRVGAPPGIHFHARRVGTFNEPVQIHQALDGLRFEPRRSSARSKPRRLGRGESDKPSPEKEGQSPRTPALSNPETARGARSRRAIAIRSRQSLGMGRMKDRVGRGRRGASRAPLKAARSRSRRVAIREKAVE
jgi:hypothetical protein